MQQTDTHHYFHYSCCADEAQSKPSPDMLNKLLDRSGVDAQDAIMVGDTTHDLKMAKAAGIKSVGVSYGVHHVDELTECNPHDIAHDVRHLMSILKC